ncbi:hypothetical protein A2160_05625 [Candidatus Beckwithbacteria bacterium RBG_13_42_9]|uniref:Uncharacterized protein n=1 Tax=Candidatus Beckwithbacteria bacterium RBG_13_42_9 TaxID=1797457 RepID=A0A1F5E658_9BACT|nr:MAG: hypothetical protein A2160_05625 [Candidatus Beckwithbacteria bacterium RBG_13_42_9]
MRRYGETAEKLTQDAGEIRAGDFARELAVPWEDRDLGKRTEAVLGDEARTKTRKTMQAALAERSAEIPGVSLLSETTSTRAMEEVMKGLEPGSAEARRRLAAMEIVLLNAETGYFRHHPQVVRNAWQRLDAAAKANGCQLPYTRDQMVKLGPQAAASELGLPEGWGGGVAGLLGKEE